RPFFDNGDWTQHTLTVYGSWVFFIIAVIAHIFVWLWRPW
ncbi:MAG: light-harvesting protein, partial [Candidatus Eremiobacteraeota bacterium]|nr:light-harvesting protein [Candidatus Eremiobacteraeota bacterium]